MSKNNNFIKELLVRKIPQIIGMYIASVWLAVEITDWMSSRFDLPVLFSSYVFVGMITFLPAVITLAWGHGKKGKDEWSAFEKTMLPINLIAAIFAVNYLVKPPEPSTDVDKMSQIPSSKQMEMRSIIDAQTGSKVMFEVPKNSFHQKVISYFWQNKTEDESLSWLSYGASWLLSQDLKRTPFISVTTPYDSRNLFNQLVDKGFKKALNVPLSLALKIARNNSVKWIVQGSYTQKDNQIEFTAQLYDVDTGKEIKKISVKNKNPLTSLDMISDEISAMILTSANVAKNVIPQLAISEHTSQSLAAIEYLIAALNQVTFNNDYIKSNELLEKALETDEKFASAHLLSMNNYRALGDIPKTIAHAKSALDLDYKLYQESVFLVKSNLFVFQGKSDKALKVLENWVKIYPHSIDALRTLGSVYFQTGHYQEKAKKVFQKLHELEGDKSNALIKLAKINRLQNKKEQAFEALNKYIAANPEKSVAYFELADAYMQFGQFDDAKEMYDEASLYENKDFRAELGNAKITAAKGDYQSSINQLQDLLTESKTDMQKIAILSQLSDLYLLTGQIRKSLEMVELISQHGRGFFPPLAKIFQIDGAKVYLNSKLGLYEKAHKQIKSLSKEVKPPYDLLLSSLSKQIYENQENVDLFKESLIKIETFQIKYNVGVLKPDILRSKGVLKYWEKDYPKALDFYNQAIEESKQSFVILVSTNEIDSIINRKAETLIAMEKYQEAIKSLDVVLMRTPIQATSHFLKAKAYVALKQLQKAHEEIIATEQIWKNSDKDFVDYQEFTQFKQQYRP
jgi:tetratricopeptide (TPR) repeat protein